MSLRTSPQTGVAIFGIMGLANNLIHFFRQLRIDDFQDLAQLPGVVLHGFIGAFHVFLQQGKAVFLEKGFYVFRLQGREAVGQGIISLTGIALEFLPVDPFDYIRDNGFHIDLPGEWHKKSWSH